MKGKIKQSIYGTQSDPPTILFMIPNILKNIRVPSS